MNTYSDDTNFLLWFLFGGAILAIGFFLFLGGPGVLIFTTFDILPSLILGGLSGGVILQIGMEFSVAWPFVVIGSFFLSKAKFGNFNKNIILNKFNLPWFLVFLFAGTFILTIIFHLAYK